MFILFLNLKNDNSFIYLQQALLDNERRRKLENAAYGHDEMPMVNNK